MKCPVIINLGTSPHIKTGQSNPVGGKGSQNQEKKSEKTRNPTVSSTTGTPNYTTIIPIRGYRSDPYKLHDCLFSGTPCGPKLVDSVGHFLAVS